MFPMCSSLSVRRNLEPCIPAGSDPVSPDHVRSFEPVPCCLGAPSDWPEFLEKVLPAGIRPVAGFAPPVVVSHVADASGLSGAVVADLIARAELAPTGAAWHALQVLENELDAAIGIAAAISGNATCPQLRAKLHAQLEGFPLLATALGKMSADDWADLVLDERWAPLDNCEDMVIERWQELADTLAPTVATQKKRKTAARKKSARKTSKPGALLFDVSTDAEGVL